MISYSEGAQRFNYRIVGVCIDRGRVLLHQLVGDDYWSTPTRVLHRDIDDTDA